MECDFSRGLGWSSTHNTLLFVQVTANRVFTWAGLQPYTQYSVRVAARTVYDELKEQQNYSEELLFRTNDEGELFCIDPTGIN